jgi:hypothetical protein
VYLHCVENATNPTSIVVNKSTEMETLLFLILAGYCGAELYISEAFSNHHIYIERERERV